MKNLQALNNQSPPDMHPENFLSTDQQPQSWQGRAGLGGVVARNLLTKVMLQMNHVYAELFLSDASLIPTLLASVSTTVTY